MSESLAISASVDEQAEIRRRIEDDIILGRLAPGTRLIEDTMMTRYHASRHYVRQALVDLERSRIVRREKNIGATVRTYSPDEVRQIYQVREMLSRQAALKIPLPAPKALIEELEAIQTEHTKHALAGDLRGLHETNDAFHLTLFSGCGNPYLVQEVQEYMSLTLPIRAKNLADKEGLRLSVKQHAVMIDLMRGTDSWALSQLCVDHMQYSKRDYLTRAA